MKLITSTLVFSFVCILFPITLLSQTDTDRFQYCFYFGTGKSGYLKDKEQFASKNIQTFSTGIQLRMLQPGQLHSYGVGLDFLYDGVSFIQDKINFYNTRLSLSYRVYPLQIKPISVQGFFLVELATIYRFSYRGKGVYEGYLDQPNIEFNKIDFAPSFGVGFKFLDKFELEWRHAFHLRHVFVKRGIPGNRNIPRSGMPRQEYTLRNWEFRINYIF